MKRPLFVMLTGLVLGEAFTSVSGKTGVFILALFMLLAFICYLSQKTKQGCFRDIRIIILLLACFGFFGGNRFYKEAYPGIIEKHLQQSADYHTLQGNVVSVLRKKDGADQLILNHATLSAGERNKSPKPVPGNVLVYLSMSGDKEILPGDTLIIPGTYQQLPAPTNPGEFDARTYYLAQGVRLKFLGGSWRLQKRKVFSFRRAAYLLKLRISRVYQAALPQTEASLLKAMALGDKTELSEEVRTRYAGNGAAHLLAVSGLHVSVLGGSFFAMMRKRGFGYLSSCVAGAFILLFYGCMTGFGSSAARAVIMYLVYLISQLLGADYDIISAMSLSGILLLAEYPWKLMEGGFQISYLSILAIGLVLPWAKQLRLKGTAGRINGGSFSRFSFCGKWITKMEEALFAGVIISGVTAPVLMRLYHEWAPAGIILNLLFLPCMGPLMLSAVLGGVAGLCVMKAGMAILLPARGILVLFQKAFDITGKLRIQAVITGCPKLWQLILIYLFETALLFLWLHRNVLRGMFFFLIISMLCIEEHSGSVSVLTSAGVLGDALTTFGAHGELVMIDMLDVGQGESILIRTPDRKSILIDGGSTSRSEVGKYVIRPALKYYGVKKLDYVVATHMDEDHISGLYELFAGDFPVKNVLLPDVGKPDPAWRAFQKTALSAGANIIKIKRGDQLRFHKMTMTCLHPFSGYQAEDRNNSSVVLYLSYRQFDMLFTGDLGEDGERELELYLAGHDRQLKNINRTLDVLKVAHHGSKYSTDENFLSFYPGLRAALISAGRGNRYGHPHRELLERLTNRNIAVYDTPKQGAVMLKTNGIKYHISGYQN